jgi:hypothetical protein
VAKKAEPPPKPEPRPLVRVAYKGILDEFKLYTDKDQRPYITLPSGKRALVEARRDGTYMLKE